MSNIPLVLRPKDWPKADTEMWAALCEAGDLFDGTGPFAGLSEGSRDIYEQGYGQWLSFLKRTRPDVLDDAPEARVREDNLRDYIDECRGRLKPRSIVNLISALLNVMIAHDGSTDWSWLRLGVNRLHAEAHSQSLPPPLPIKAGEIFRWSLTRFAEISAAEYTSDLQRAIHVRQALMIGFLIARPIRRRSLLCMEVGTHIIPDGEGYRLRFDGHEMKDGRARSFLLPAKLVPMMQAYLDHHRPVLANGKDTNALWLSQYGDPITEDGLSRELPKVTQKYLGVEMRPHAFRHVAATSVAETDPEHVNIIKDILGHATLDMSQRHYNRAQGLSVATELQSIVEDIQKSMPIVGRAKRHDQTERPTS